MHLHFITLPSKHMNIVDVVLCIPLIWGLYKGLTKGLVIEVASLVALALGIWGGIRFSDYAASFLARFLDFQTEYLPIIAFALIFIVIVVGVFALAKVMEKVINMASLKMLNKLAGALFGMLKVGLILSVLLMILNAFDDRSNFFPPEMKHGSLLYEPVSDIAPTIIPAVRNSKLYGEVTEIRP